MEDHDRALLNTIRHPIFALEKSEDGSVRYVLFNAYACNAAQFQERDILGKTAAEVYPGRLGRLAYEHHMRAFETGLSRSYEIHLPIAGGHRRVRTSLDPVLDADGKVIRVFGSSIDITGIAAANELHTNVETWHSELEDFVNLAAHDLRRPMQQIGMIADLLQEDFEDMGDGKLELIEMLKTVATKTTALISDVLSQTQAARAVSDVTEFDLGALTDDILTMLDPMGACDCHTDNAWLSADRTAVLIILRNLIDNALKFAQPEHNDAHSDDRLRIDVSACAAEGEFIQITLRDNGIGFDASTLLFLQGGRFETGSGYGLMGVRRLLRARGGSISAWNDEDAGAVISFTLPGQIHARERR